MVRPGPVPGFPRWTGVKAVMTGPEHVRDGALTVVISVRLTRRAYLWAYCRLMLGKGVPSAAA